MFIKGDRAFASIGVNCLSEVQFIKRLTVRKGIEPEERFKGYNQIRGPFDSGGVSPDALIEILNLIKSQKAIEWMSNINEYFEEVQPDGDIFYGHKYIHGFTLTHEDEDLNNFSIDMKNRIDNFNNLPKDTTLLWCNAQANFGLDLRTAGMTIEDYYLTKKRYKDISSLINEIYGHKVKFAVRDIYTDKELLDMPNVYTVDIPFGTFNLFGTKSQFDPIFQEEQ